MGKLVDSNFNDIDEVATERDAVQSGLIYSATKAH
jgi:hypothetical protein